MLLLLHLFTGFVLSSGHGRITEPPKVLIDPNSILITMHKHSPIISKPFLIK